MFLTCKATHVRGQENFAFIVDSTPDSSYVGKTTFLLSYVIPYENQYEIIERILHIVDTSHKIGYQIAQMILETLKEHDIPLSDCRAQGYDNADNMAGKYKGAQARIHEQCVTALFSPCGCHTLNFCGNDAAQCISEAITYFGTVQTVQFQSTAMGNLAEVHWLFYSWHV